MRKKFISDIAYRVIKVTIEVRGRIRAIYPHLSVGEVDDWDDLIEIHGDDGEYISLKEEPHYNELENTYYFEEGDSTTYYIEVAE